LQAGRLHHEFRIDSDSFAAWGVQKYTFDIQCNGESRKLVMARASGESEQHLALKLLAYLLYFDRRPKVETGVGQHPPVPPLRSRSRMTAPSCESA
jgi:hypothetical protein